MCHLELNARHGIQTQRAQLVVGVGVRGLDPGVAALLKDPGVAALLKESGVAALLKSPGVAALLERGAGGRAA